MTTIASLINAPTALVLPPPASIGPADTVSTRATLSALPAPLPDLATNNDARNPGAVVSANTQLVNTTSAAAATSNPLNTSLNASGPSAPFLAQLLGQDDEDSSISLATDFAHFAPAPAYNTFVAYGYIKYKPSDAGVPSQISALPATGSVAKAPPPVLEATTPAQNDNASPTPAANDYQAYSAAQSRNQPASQPQLIIAG